jgi:hypothetical protein
MPMASYEYPYDSSGTSNTYLSAGSTSSYQFDSTTIGSNSATWRTWVIAVPEPATAMLVSDDNSAVPPTITIEIRGDAWGQWVAEVREGTNHISDEERARRAAETEERQRRVRQTAAEQRKKNEEANARAEALLKSALTKKELEEYETAKTVTVKVSDTKSLRIKPGRSSNIEELDENGNVVAHLCVHLEERVPDHDNMLAQILFAQSEPEEFLALANRYAVP